MKKKLFMLLAAFLCLGAQAQAPVHVTVTNPSKEARRMCLWLLISVSGEMSKRL